MKAGRRQLLVVLAMALAVCLAASPARATLIGYWNFEGSTDAARSTDKTGLGHDITLFSGAAFGTDVPTIAGGGGGGFSLDCMTAGGYAIVSDIANNFNLGSAMTVTAWVKGWPGTWNPFISKNGEPNGWQVRNHGGGATMDWTTRGTTFPNNGDMPGNSTVVGDGNWHFIAVTFDGTTKKMYVDSGTPDATSTVGAPTSISASTDPLVFAARSNGGIGNQSPVKLDNVAIFNTALTDAQIAAIANGASPLTTNQLRLKVQGVTATGAAAVTDPNGVVQPGTYSWKIDRLTPGALPPPLQGTFYTANNTALPLNGSNQQIALSSLSAFNTWAGTAAASIGPINLPGSFSLTNLRLPGTGGSTNGNPFVDAVGTAIADFATHVPAYNNNEYLVARLDGKIYLGATGTWTFGTNSDDGSSIFLDGVDAPVVNNAYLQGQAAANGGPQRTGTYNNTLVGLHDFTGLFYEQTGGAGAEFYYQAPGGSMIEIPLNAFQHQDITVTNLLSGAGPVGGQNFDGFFGNLPDWAIGPQQDLRLTMTYNGQNTSIEGLFDVTPEPATCLLLGGGLLALIRRRRQRTVGSRP